MTIRRCLTGGIWAAAMVLLAGCDLIITNYTGRNVPQNPSNIYRISMAVDTRNATVVEDSILGSIVIDGERYTMDRSDAPGHVFNYEYRLPPGRNQARYYFIVNYTVRRDNATYRRTKTTEIYTLDLQNRYVVTLESYRAPVGTRIPVLGRSFSQGDQVIVGGTPADTQYVSPNNLEFTVPALPAHTDYEVVVDIGGGQQLFVPEPFRIDEAELTVAPQSLRIPSGSRMQMVVNIGRAAPAGGLPVEVRTNVPSSVIMPEVVVREGDRTVSVPIEGGTPGEGLLLVSAPGFNTVRIPVTVTGEGS